MFNRIWRADAPQRIASTGHYRSLARAGALLSCAAVAACQSVQKINPPTEEDAGVLRMAQVMHLASRHAILQNRTLYTALILSGIKDSDMRDGAVAVGRTYCCGGPNEEAMAMWFYVPTGVTLANGDIVEVRMGRQPSGDAPGAANAAVRVREKSNDEGKTCRWTPEQPPGLWMRILYCDWMKQEGWRERVGGNYSTWYKPAS